ncbi:MAG: dehydratase [Alphaproteobacteria bacterium]|nr:MAG: dehydratase [Alphaproteobacteria bacterium]
MGRTYEEFEVGQRFETPHRTVTEADIDSFAGLTADFNPVHMDDVFAAENGFGGRITHGPMIVGMAFGLASRADVMDGTVLALLEIGWKFIKPVRPGDTISAIFTVIEKRPTRAPDRGVVTLQIDVLNQHGDVVQTGTATALIRGKSASSG